LKLFRNCGLARHADRLWGHARAL